MQTFAPVKRIQTDNLIRYIYIYIFFLCTNATATQTAARNIQRKHQSSDGSVVLTSSAQRSEGIA